jgi:hypothetical protein
MPVPRRRRHIQVALIDARFLAHHTCTVETTGQRLSQPELGL